MDNSKELEELGKNVKQLTSTSTHFANAQHLSDENQKLKDTLTELLASANQNQLTQERFYELELFFLESRTYDSLLNRLLVDLKQKLRLTQVELILVDADYETQQLIQEIYGNLEFDNLAYVNSVTEIKTIYQGSIRLQLTQNETLLEQLFGGAVHSSKSAALIPLLRGNQIIGSLHLGSRDKNRFHSGLATNFLQHLGSIVSVCIENSINQERFVHLSLVDMLTRAKNRRYFFQALAKEIARSSRSLAAVSCLFIDIDHFKTINDSKGHLIGDRALREVSKSIQPLLRQSDILARFGGEEFTVLLADCDSAHALEIAERIRQSIAELSLEDKHGEQFNLTISIGVSTWYPDKNPLSNPNDIQDYLVNSADHAVYQAKAEGRNCVRVALTETNTSNYFANIKQEVE